MVNNRTTLVQNLVPEKGTGPTCIPETWLVGLSQLYLPGFQVMAAAKGHGSEIAEV